MLLTSDVVMVNAEDWVDELNPFVLNATTSETGAEELPLTLNEIWVRVALNPVFGVIVKPMKSFVKDSVPVVFHAELENRLDPLSAVSPVRVTVDVVTFASLDEKDCSEVTPLFPVIS